MASQETVPAYKAFVSYSRHDEASARWLHRSLESYVLPAATRLSREDKPFERRPLRPVFRDSEELVPGADLPARIRTSLEASEFLIVLCSPHAAASRWVDQEVSAFVAVGREDRILAVVLDGEPNASAPELECFPPSLKAVAEPLWVDLRPAGRGGRAAFLRLVAALLGLKSLDQLIQRDRAARARRAIAAVAAVVLFLGVTVGGSLAALEAERNRSRTFATASEVALERGDTDTALAYALLSLPPPRGSLFDVSTPELHRTAAKAAFLNDALYAGPGNDAFSPDGRFALTRDGRYGEVWDLRYTRRIGRYQWPDFLGWSLNVFTPDSRFLLADREDGVAVVDTQTGRQRLWPGVRLRDGLAVSRDGRTAASRGGSRWDDITIWRFPELTRQLVFTGTTDGDHVALSPDGSRVAVGGLDAIDVWDTRSGRRLGRLSGPPTDGVVRNTDAAFSPDGRYLLVDWGDQAWVWDTALDLVVIRHFQPSVWVGDILQAFSDDGRRLILVNGDDSATIYDLPDTSRARVVRFGTQPVVWAKLSPDGRRALTASRNGPVQLWNADTAENLGSLSYKPKGQKEGVAFTNDGQGIVIAEGVVASVWNATASRAGRLLAPGDGRSVMALAAAPDEQTMAAVDGRGVVRLLSVDGQPLRTISTGVISPAHVAFSGDGSLLAVSGRRTVIVVDVKSGRTLPSLADGLHQGAGVASVAFSPDSTAILVGLSNATARVIDRASGRTRFTLDGHANEVVQVAWSPDGRWLISADAEGLVQVWDARTGRRQAAERLRDGEVRGLTVAPDASEFLAVTGEAISVRDLPSARQRLRLTLDDAFFASAQFTANGQRIVSQGGQVWATRTGLQIRRIETDPVATAPTARFLATRDLRVLDTLSTDVVVQLAPDTYAAATAVLPRTGRVVAGFEDGSVRLWRAPEMSGGRALARALCAADPRRRIALTDAAMNDPLVRSVVRRGDAAPCDRGGLFSLGFWSRLLPGAR